jgi:hypothetical protein
MARSRRYRGAPNFAQRLAWHRTVALGGGCRCGQGDGVTGRAGLQLGDGECGKATWRACGARHSGLERKASVRGRPGESPLCRWLLCFSKTEGERLGMTTGDSSSASTREGTVVLWCDAAWAVAGLVVIKRRGAAPVVTRGERWASS